MLQIEVDAKFAKNLKERLTGLIGKHKAHGLLLKTRFGIHTFGLKFPIDVLVLDQDNIVVKMKKNLKPHRVFVWNPKYDSVLELPGNSIEENKISLGQKITISQIAP